MVGGEKILLIEKEMTEPAARELPKMLVTVTCGGFVVVDPEQPMTELMF